MEFFHFSILQEPKMCTLSKGLIRILKHENQTATSAVVIELMFAVVVFSISSWNSVKYTCVYFPVTKNKERKRK